MVQDLYTSLAMLCFAIAAILIFTPVVFKSLMEEISIKNINITILGFAKTNKGKLAIIGKLEDGSVEKFIQGSDFYITTSKNLQKTLVVGNSCSISVFGRKSAFLGRGRQHFVGINAA